jgi:hypothetical protein
MEEVDQELRNNFKSIAEYFAKKSRYEIIYQYEKILGLTFNENSSRGEFSSLMNVYRNSSPNTGIRMKFYKDIDLLSAKNEYIKSFISFFSAIKTDALQILPNFDMLMVRHRHIPFMKNIVEYAKEINLLNIGSTTSTIIIYYDDDKLHYYLLLIRYKFLDLKNGLPLRVFKSNIYCILYLF